MKAERGFTMVELAITLVITGFLVAATGLVVRDIITVPERSNDQVSATHAIQNAAHWVSLDGQTASAATGGSSLVLTIPGSENVTYSLSGSELHRISGGSNRVVARGISAASFSVAGRLITINMTTSTDRLGISQNISCQVDMRPS